MVKRKESALFAVRHFQHNTVIRSIVVWFAKMLLLEKNEWSGKLIILIITEIIQEKGKKLMFEIKSCPHCGCDATLTANWSYKAKKYFVFVKCDMCGSQGKVYRSDTDPDNDKWKNIACYNAVKAWNMRKDVIDNIEDIDFSQINLYELLREMCEYSSDFYHDIKYGDYL